MDLGKQWQAKHFNSSSSCWCLRLWKTHTWVETPDGRLSHRRPDRGSLNSDWSIRGSTADHCDLLLKFLAYLKTRRWMSKKGWHYEQAYSHCHDKQGEHCYRNVCVSFWVVPRTKVWLKLVPNGSSLHGQQCQLKLSFIDKTDRDSVGGNTGHENSFND